MIVPEIVFQCISEVIKVQSCTTHKTRLGLHKYYLHISLNVKKIIFIALKYNILHNTYDIFNYPVTIRILYKINK